MTTPHELDPRLVAWLDDGPTDLPPTARQGIVDATLGLDQRRRRVGWAMPIGRPRRRLAVAVVILAAIGVAAGSLAAGWPRADESVVPDVRPAPPSVTPDDPAVVGLERVFESPRYGYRVTLPDTLTLEPATVDWHPGRWFRGWRDDTALFADVYRETPGARPMFWAVVTPVEARTTADTFAPANVPNRIEYRADACDVEISGSRTQIAHGTIEWERVEIAGRDWAVRRACGYADGVVVIGQAAYVFTLWTGHGPYADLDAFKAVAGTLDFDGSRIDDLWVPPPMGDGGGLIPRLDLGPLDATFTSTRYAFSIDHPSAWEARRSDRAWTGDRTWSAAGVADIVAPDDGQGLAVVAMDVPESMTVKEAIEQFVPTQPEFVALGDGHRHCEFRENGGWRAVEHYGTPGWVPTELGEYDAVIRTYCGFVEAVITIDRRIWVLSLVPRRDYFGDAARFRKIVETLYLDPDAPLVTAPTEP